MLYSHLNVNSWLLRPEDLIAQFRPAKLFRMASYLVVLLAFARAVADCVVTPRPVRVDRSRQIQQLTIELQHMQAGSVLMNTLVEQLEKIGTLYCEEGHYRRAEPFYSEALKRAQAAGSAYSMRQALILLAEMHRDAGNFKLSFNVCHRIIEMDKSQKRADLVVEDLDRLAMAYYLAGCSTVSQEQRRRLFVESDRTYKIALKTIDENTIHDKGSKLLTINSYAQLLIEQNRLPELHALLASKT